MPTKAELQTENDLLKELNNNGITIHSYHIQGSPQKSVCKAITEIAIALQLAAKALQGSAAISINQGER